MMGSPLARALGSLAVVGLAACGDGSTPEPSGVHGLTPPAGCEGACADTPTALTAADVQVAIARAVAEAQSRGAAPTIAVVDRVGNVLGVFRMFGGATSVTLTAAAPGAPVSGGLEDVTLVPTTLAAIAKALTAAYLSTEGNAFTTRTAGQILQEHFNPGERLAPGGPLFGVQFSQLPCSDLLHRFGGAPTPGPHRSPLGLAADPGGVPLYKAGTVVGAIGVESDATYGIDRDVTDIDVDRDELIALAGAFGLGAPGERRGERITVDGKVLRFSDATEQSLAANPNNPPSYASVDGVAGTLVAVPGYFGGAATAAGTAFGHAASGIRPDRLDYAGLDAFVLVDALDVERFRPQAGTDGAAALTAGEVRAVLRAALALANRSRAQIRRPLGTPARVTISVVDTNGAVLGIVRSRDAPVFGVDVSLQKARSAAFFSSAAAAAALTNVPAATYLNGGLVVLRDEPLGQYVGALRSFVQRPTALADGAVAFSARALGNLSRPFFPDGLDGGPAGPLSKPPGEWSPFSTGLELDLVYNALVQHVGFVLGAAPDVGLNCTGVDGFDAGFAVVAPIAALANGAQIFPGGVPIYRGATLVGAIGVSGDGVDQDDLVAFLAVHEAGEALGTIGNAAAPQRADTLAPLGLALRFVSCPVAPFIGSSEQSVCTGK